MKKTSGLYRLYLMLLGFILISHLPVGGIFFSIKPAVILMTIFVFSIFPQTRPNSFMLIMLGLLSDFIGSDIIGISSLHYVLMLFFASLNSSALIKQRFNVVWISVAVCLASIYIMDIVIYSAVFDKYKLTMELALEYLASVLLYPLLHRIYISKIQWFSKHDLN